MMLPDEILLTKYGGMNINSLNNVLNVARNKKEENEIPLLKHSPYVNTDELIPFCEEKANNFTILSLNVQSLIAKFDQIQILLSQLKSTRLSEKSGSLIDNFYCKLTPNVSDVSACILTSGLSDHFPYCISINITCPKALRVKHVYINNMTNDIIKNFKLEIKNANLLNQINIDQHTDPNINYGVIKDVLFAAKLKHVSRIFGHKNTWSIIKNLLHKKKVIYYLIK